MSYETLYASVIFNCELPHRKAIVCFLCPDKRSLVRIKVLSVWSREITTAEDPKNIIITFAPGRTKKFRAFSQSSNYLEKIFWASELWWVWRCILTNLTHIEEAFIRGFNKYFSHDEILVDIIRYHSNCDGINVDGEVKLRFPYFPRRRALSLPLEEIFISKWNVTMQRVN